MLLLIYTSRNMVNKTYRNNMMANGRRLYITWIATEALPSNHYSCHILDAVNALR